MIIGIGTDIVEVARIEEIMKKFGPHFSRQILCPSEAAKMHTGAEFLAGRWAAKEAVAKALGCGFGAHCAICDIEIANEPSGSPFVILHGKALERMREKKIGRIHLSITHEKKYAAATAVAEE